MIGGQKTAAAALLVSVFLAGALGGAVGTKLMDRRPWRGEMDRMDHFGRPGGGAPWGTSPDVGMDKRGFAPMWLSDMLTKRLGLTAEQESQVRAILETRQARADEALSEMVPRLKAELDSIHMEIRAVLTPEQQLLFDEFKAQEDERMFRRMQGTRPGSPPGGGH